MELSLLQDYLAYVQERAQTLGISDVHIKVCRGQYPESLGDPRISEGYKGYQTIFFKAVNAENDEALDQVMGLNIFSPRPPY